MTQAQRTLNNRYELIAKLGDGGMAVVYKALDKRLNRTVAVKILRESYASDEQFLQRFMREAQSAAGLNHPNIVNVHDTGQDGEIYYIVMEYINGQNLKEYIINNAPLPTAEAVDIAAQVCDAIGYSHSQGLVHRDIKPQNILLERDGRVKVTDFGIAKGAGDATLTQAGITLGTVHYFSPEQAKGLPAQPQSDLYSIGIVLYEMLTGRIPFESDNPVALALKHIEEPPPAVRRFNPAVPAALEQIVMRSLSKNPSQRYPNAASFAKALRDFENASEMGTRAVASPPPPAATTYNGRAASVTPDDRTSFNAPPLRPTYREPDITPPPPPPARPNYAANGYTRGQAQFTGARSGAYRNEPPPVPYTDDEFFDEQPRQRGGCVPWAIGLLLISMIIGLVVLFFVFLFPILTKPANVTNPTPAAAASPTTTAQKVKVPNVIGRNVDDATKALTDAGLPTPETKQVNSDKQAKEVIDQSVKANQEVDKTTKITLTVSKGKETVTYGDFPDVFNRDQNAIKGILDAKGLKYQIVQEPNDKVNPTAVIRLDPDPKDPNNQQIAKDTVVKIIVSTGPLPTATPIPPTATPVPPTNTPEPTPVPPTATPIPNVVVPSGLVGQKRQDAEKALKSFGFEVEILELDLAGVQQKFPGDQSAVDTWKNLKNNDVLGTDPRENTLRPKGSKVLLAIKKGGPN